MLDGSISHFRGVRSILLLLFYTCIRWKILLANNVGPDQMPHYVVSDLGLHCLPWTLLQVSRYEWVKTVFFSTLANVLWTQMNLKIYYRHESITDMVEVHISNHISAQ